MNNPINNDELINLVKLKIQEYGYNQELGFFGFYTYVEYQRISYYDINNISLYFKSIIKEILKSEYPNKKLRIPIDIIYIQSGSSLKIIICLNIALFLTLNDNISLKLLWELISILATIDWIKDKISHLKETKRIKFKSKIIKIKPNQEIIIEEIYFSKK